jgi:CheY-like chemotaxis protein
MKNLFLIEDDEDDQLLFKMAIEDIKDVELCGIAENGKAALQTLCTYNQGPDLIFLDINMPVMNGLEFLREFKTNASINKTPVILMSTIKYEIDHAKKLGALTAIAKPDSIGLLTKRIVNIMDLIF